jgi:pimeloyl-ACP methyl ester carboxylesterase
MDSMKQDVRFAWYQRVSMTLNDAGSRDRIHVITSTPNLFRVLNVTPLIGRLISMPNDFPKFIKRVIAMDLKPYDFGAEKPRATKAPIFFIHGDADGVRLEHIAEMFRLKGDEIFGDMRPRSPSRLAILPNTTHVTLMQKVDTIAPMINDFLDAKPETKTSGGSR